MKIGGGGSNFQGFANVGLVAWWAFTLGVFFGNRSAPVSKGDDKQQFQLGQRDGRTQR